MGGSDVSLSLRLVLAGAWAAVRSRSRGQFPRVLGLLEAVGRAAPGAVRFRHGARLRLGLQAAVVVQMLQEAQPDGKIFDAVDSFFPEGEVLAEGHGLATPQELAMVGEAQESFRELVLSLLADRGRRVAYLQSPQGPAGEEYGERFLRALERLFYEYLQRLESALPPPDLRQLQAMVWSHAPPQPRPSDLPILSQYLMDMGHARCDWVGDVIGDIKDETNPRRKARPLPFPRRTDSDRERDRDRHRAHGQGGADQGAGGGEGGDPPPAAAAHLQRQADERRENGGRLQDPGRLRPPSCPRPARGRGPRLTSRLAISPAQEGAGRPLPDPTPSELPSPARSPI
ncbi:TERF1-interacting nuclear factor 2 isoform X3 [Strix uralensis]|uniref:TERF1-interacting nuclear factor 2 isoform X3 n=1 Tax=Strix uralensis TaxID=36305 RepID=UPI003DA588C5